MELIKNLEIKPFLRVIWTSQKAREMWENILSQCSNLVQELEILSVQHNQRKCAWRTIKLKSLPEFSKNCNDKGLIVLPVKLIANWGQGFAHKTYEAKPDDPNCNVYCIIAKELKYAIEFRDAHEKGDHITQGRMLGFPECCISFFDKYWKEGYFDPIWQLATNIPSCNQSKNSIEINNYHPYSNPLLRYIGIRIGFHIPCSLNCTNTQKMAVKRLELVKDEDLIKILQALLSMPMSWECYHGIAIVRTPIFYIITSSLPTVQKYLVKIKGKYKPLESVNGVVFPFTKEE